ncbi:DUF6879 family protein [Streptomyces capparidis]
MTSDEWAGLFRSAKKSVLHLETRDSYAVDDEEFAQWKAGALVDPADRSAWWVDWWHGSIADSVHRGVPVRRARVVSEPVSEYIRFEHDVTYTNVEAGEEVRWLPRRNASDIALPGNDFWMFDDDLVVFNHFTGEGAWAGHERRSEPAVIRLCATAFEAVWERAVPHAEYTLPESP